MKCCFIAKGYEILSATDGVSALKIAKREWPDAIILDFMMPLDLIERIIEQPAAQ